VDDFQLIALLELGGGPAVPGNDVEVEFDGDSIGLHAEGFDESGESGVGGIEGFRFAVDLEFQGHKKRLYLCDQPLYRLELDGLERFRAKQRAGDAILETDFEGIWPY
jgi:hypothetical protein